MLDVVNDNFVAVGKCIGKEYDKGEGGWYGSGTELTCNYSAFRGIEKVMVRAVCCWMALRVGRRQKVFPMPEFGPSGGLRFDTLVPYISYDGLEAWPVLQGEQENPDCKRWRVDDLGMVVDLMNNANLLLNLGEVYLRTPDGGKISQMVWDSLGPGGVAITELELEKLKPFIDPVQKKVKAAMQLLDHAWENRFKPFPSAPTA